MHLLIPGTSVTGVNENKTFIVEEFLYENSSCEVYASGVNHNIRWLKNARFLQEQRKILENLINCPKSAETHFLWPIDIVESQDADGFGYITPIGQNVNLGIADITSNKVPYSIILQAALHLVDAFRELHEMGLCFGGITFESKFFNAVGKVFIEDVNHIFKSGSGLPYRLNPPFTAPEIVTKSADLSEASDLHSLTVLLFLMLYRQFPLKQPSDYNSDEMFYGENPSFLFEDAQLAPDNIFWQNIYPRSLDDMFRLSFTTFLKEPTSRFDVKKWKMELIKLRDGLFFCPHCKSVNFAEPLPQNSSPVPSVSEETSVSKVQNQFSVAETEILTPKNREETLALDIGMETSVSQTGDEKQISNSEIVIPTPKIDIEIPAPTVPQSAVCWKCGMKDILPLRIEFRDGTVVQLALGKKLYSYDVDSGDTCKPVAEVITNPTTGRMGLSNIGKMNWDTWKGNSLLSAINSVPPSSAITISQNLNIDFGVTIGQKGAKIGTIK